MRVQLVGVSKWYGAEAVLTDVTLSISGDSRIGVVGPNGVGKSTLLRLLAGLEEPDRGTVSRTPESVTCGYLPQEPGFHSGETLLGYLGRRTHVAEAQQALEGRAAALAGVEGDTDAYSAALEHFLGLGGGDLKPRARVVCAQLGLDVGLERPMTALSGGEAARAALAAILLSRFDLLLLDEPTNDLDFDGLERLEHFLAHRGGVALVSHDRELLDRTVTDIVEIEPGTRAVREWPGGFSRYQAAQHVARRAQYARFEQAEERRREVAELLARRRTEARAGGAMADRRGTRALRAKVRQAERALERSGGADKPFEPWQLRLRLEAGEVPSDLVLRLQGAVTWRGPFQLGPIDLDLVPGERLYVTGPNGSGKSTLLGLLEGTLPLTAGRRAVGRRTSLGALDQRRAAYVGATSLLDRFCRRSGESPGEARTLLAKFGLGADAVQRHCASLSPGERTRTLLAELQARHVNLLLLDEPTNHLDLEAVEQLEEALSEFEGTVVLVSHDRRFVEQMTLTRRIELPLR